MLKGFKYEACGYSWLKDMLNHPAALLRDGANTVMGFLSLIEVGRKKYSIKTFTSELFLKPILEGSKR